MQMSQDMPV